jgi:hypothetical protein
MSKKSMLALAILFLAVVPCGLYVIINFYWWLFDGNLLVEDKMGGACLVFFSGLCVLLMIAASDES